MFVKVSEKTPVEHRDVFQIELVFSENCLETRVNFAKKVQDRKNVQMFGVFWLFCSILCFSFLEHFRFFSQRPMRAR